MVILQPLRHRDDVIRHALVTKLTDGAEDNAVVLAIKIFFPHPFGHLVPGLLVEKNTAEYSLFGLDGMWRYFQRCRFGITRQG